MLKVGDRVSVAARRFDGIRVVVRALVGVDLDRDGFFCVRVPAKLRWGLGSYPHSLRLSERGISWAQGWHSREADAFRVTVAL